MGKVIFVATVVKKHIMSFHIPFLKMFKEMGWETVVVARNDYDDPAECDIPYCDKHYDLPFERSPLKASNISCIKQLKKIIAEEKPDIIHCHTPVGGVVARMAAGAARKRGTKVIYTAHGFHFYKGAPLKNWLVYYPVEWLCSFKTDTLITINQEDYERASKHMHAKSTVYVPGVGIDLERFGGVDVDRAAKRAELGIPEDARLLISVGEVNENKNHEAVIRAINGMDVYYIIAGVGDRHDALQAIIDGQGMTDRIKLLGFRTDVRELYAVSDMFVFPSFREGLSVSVMEAMASELPCVVSRIRGNTDLVDDKGGALFDPANVASVKEAVVSALGRDGKEMGRYNREKVTAFGLESVTCQMRDIYNR